MTEKIKQLFSISSSITTATLMVTSFWFILSILSEGESIFNASIPVMILPEILALGFTTGIGTVLIFSKENLSRKEDLILRIIHFLFICIVVLGMGAWFGWYSPTPLSVLLMLCSILAVYLFTYFINFNKSKQLADKLNEKLEHIN